MYTRIKILTSRPTSRFTVISLLIAALIQHAYAADMHGYCGENATLFNITDRPSIADSVCVVPYGKQILEFAFSTQKTLTPSNQVYHFPDMEYRLGIPKDNEIYLVLPTRLMQSAFPHSGFATTTIGIKHTVYTKSDTLLLAVESSVSPPGGGTYYGNKNWEANVAAIMTYNFKIPLSYTFMLGFSSLTTASAFGGDRYDTVNPDLVISYVFGSKYSIYIEGYGQSRTAPQLGCGYNADAGVLYLPTKNTQVDLSFGKHITDKHITGKLSNFENYVSLGFATMF